MRAILFSFLASIGGVAPAYAETLHSNGGSSSVADSSPNSHLPSADQITQELKCSLQGLKVRSEEAHKRAEELAKEFAKIWSTLEGLGVRPPSPIDRAHFYSQILYESGHFLNQIELDPSKSKIKDAETWRGRGPIQLSHCANYASFAYFYQKYRKGEVRGRRLFDHPTDLWVAVPGKRRPALNCPPESVQDSIIITAPDFALGNHPLANRFLSALSAVWWWEEKKLRSKEFREGVQIDSENAVELVTFYVKGSTDTSKQRKEKYNAVRRCIKKS